VLTTRSITEGALAGLGAVLAIWITRKWLDNFKEDGFAGLPFFDADQRPIAIVAKPEATFLNGKTIIPRPGYF
jgi:hypothetical protein